MSFAFAAAGTGGHVYPALAVAEALVERGVPSDRIVFLGGRRVGAAAVPKAGFAFRGYDLPRLRRAVTTSNLLIPFRLLKVTRAMRSELEEHGVRAVLGTSGYATVPASLAASRLGIPFFLQEQNAVPGLAARFASRRAAATFLGLPGPAERLARSRMTGNPLRSGFASFDRPGRREEARRRYGVASGATVIGVLGGSLGARVLNESVPGIIDAWRGGPLEIVHLTGSPALEEMTRRAEGSPLPWRCVGFEDVMEDFYAAVDLVVGRAGAMTISELAVTGTPAVLVPLEAVGQQANAAALVEAGGAVVVPQAEVADLPAMVSALAADPARLQRLAAGGRTLARPRAAAAIADAMLEAVHG